LNPFGKRYHSYLLDFLHWGILAAGTKATAGNARENGMGMTEGTEYME